MNLQNDLNIPPDPPGEPWPAKIGRLVRDVFLPYAVPYVIPVFLGWKLTRSLEVDPDERIASLKAEISRLQQRVDNYRGHMITTQKREDQKLEQINRDLYFISDKLTERQDIYYSPFKTKESRKAVERRLKEFVVERSCEQDLKIYKGIEEILEHDKHCGSNRDENGCLMWVYVDLWRTKAQLNRHKRVLQQMRAHDSKYK